MKNFKLNLVLLSASLFSTNSLVVASVSNCGCADCCGNVGSLESFYSPDNNFKVSKSFTDDLVVFERFGYAERCVSYKDCPGVMERVSWSKTIFEFRNLISFSFSRDSKYLLVERSEYNEKINAQNDYIEIFDLVNEKRIFFMPFYKKCYPSQNYYSNKSYDIDDSVFLNFYGDTLQSVEFDFEGNYIFVPANLYNVSSVYASQLGIGLSVKFNDGSIKVYIPTKDFSGFNEMLSFGKSLMVSDLVNNFHGYMGDLDKVI